MRARVGEWNEEGVATEAKKIMPEKGPGPFLPKRWIVEQRTLSWSGQDGPMSKDHARVPESLEALISVAMSR